MINDVAAGPVSGNFHKNVIPEKMKETCADFESLFLSYILKSMRAGISQAGMEGKSHESSIMYSMLDEKLSEEIAKSGGIGLADMMYERLVEQRQIIKSRT